MPSSTCRRVRGEEKVRGGVDGRRGGEEERRRKRREEEMRQGRGAGAARWEGGRRAHLVGEELVEARRAELVHEVGRVVNPCDAQPSTACLNDGNRGREMRRARGGLLVGERDGARASAEVAPGPMAKVSERLRSTITLSAVGTWRDGAE
jgi:hypothetical protein